MIFAILLAIAGLTISAVAIYYSVIGLTAIFAAAFWPVIVMGITLEGAKLVAATWLKAEWHRIPKLLKIYLTTAVLILMMITSMGIFGFLSKAHLDQNIVSGDVVDKVALIDEKIKTQRDNISAARAALQQMNNQVNERLSRSTDDKGAERAVQIRRQQQAERNRLQKEIADSQSAISKLNEERAPIAKDLRKVEAEVGPIKYIAKLIYGDNPDANILEKAVTWVIIMIVIVFDPLAVLLLISSQMAYQWYRQEKRKENIQPQTISNPAEAEAPHRVEAVPAPIVVEGVPEHIVADTYPEGKSQNKEEEANAIAAENPPEVDVEAVLERVESKNLTVDTTQKTVDGAELYGQGKIEELPQELVEKFDDEKLEEESKKKSSYIMKDHGQQIKKIKDE